MSQPSNTTGQVAVGGGVGGSAPAKMNADAPWPARFESYGLVGKIGQGAFASVFRAHCRENDRPCAIKVLDLENIDTNLVDIRLEVQTMRLSSHPNILSCYTSFVKDTQLWLVTQLMNKGSSLDCIQFYKKITRHNKDRGICGAAGGLEDHVTFIMHETLMGLKYIHENGQIHRDIKAGNILLDGFGQVRIADFGVSGWLVHSGSYRENTKTFVGTPCWMAPEVMEQVHGYNYKADVWSFGITALELVKGYAPYAKYPPMKVLLMTIQEDPPSLDTYEDGTEIDDFANYSKSFRDMIKLCLQKDAHKRPTCDELLNHRHFKCFADNSFREKRRERIKYELLNRIDDLGKGGSERSQRRLPGAAPIYLLSSTQPDRPAGTSWVFADGSQVLASTLSDSQNDDDDFFDEFERTTKGENFSSLTAKKEEEERRRWEERKHQEEIVRQREKQEMDDFYDEFEKTTGGENFKKPI